MSFFFHHSLNTLFGVTSFGWDGFLFCLNHAHFHVFCKCAKRSEWMNEKKTTVNKSERRESKKLQGSVDLIMIFIHFKYSSDTSRLCQIESYTFIIMCATLRTQKSHRQKYRSNQIPFTCKLITLLFVSSNQIW